jgi:hypothetical protein
MAEASSLNSSLIEELTDGLETDLQLSEYKVMKTSKGKDAILHDGYYYNQFRVNKSSVVFKCRCVVDEIKKKECTGTFTLHSDGKFKLGKGHQHDPMETIQTDIMLALAEVDKIIISNPTTSIKNVYDQKEIELVNKYGPELVAAYWPEFETKDSTYFAHKNKFVPKLPTSLLDLKDLPADYKLTTTKKPFLASPIDKISQYLLLSSFIGLSILCNSEKWWCDGTFKTAPKFFYQHYIIHGKYKNKYPLPGMFSFMAGKSYDLYSLMLIQLKEAAQTAGLTLAPKIIHCDFEKGA